MRPIRRNMQLLFFTQENKPSPKFRGLWKELHLRHLGYTAHSKKAALLGAAFLISKLFRQPVLNDACIILNQCMPHTGQKLSIQIRTTLSQCISKRTRQSAVKIIRTA